MQSLKVKVDTAKLTRAFKAAPVETAKELKKGTAKACQAVVLKSLEIHRFKASSASKAEQAIMYKVNSTGTTGTVYLNDVVAPHAIYQHEGTRDHFVAPKKKSLSGKKRGVLYWVSNSGKFFSGGHKVRGIRPDRFLNKSLKLEQENIGKIMTAAVHKALVKVGLK